MLKKWLVLAIILSFPAMIAAEDVPDEPDRQIYGTLVEGASTDKPVDAPGVCPRTKVRGELGTCMTCHIVPGFELKESDLNAYRVYPIDCMEVLKDKDNKEYGSYSLDGEINEDAGKRFVKFFQYLKSHKINKAVIEIYSGGGDLFEAWKIKGIICKNKEDGIQITTRAYSIAASAASLLFLTGDVRQISPTAELMFHELLSTDGLKVISPADKEDESRVLRHIQDGIAMYVSERCRMSKSSLDEKVRKKEYWVHGFEAIKLGMATDFIGK